MKILIVTNGLTRAGGMRVISNIANEMIALGDDVSILCPDGSVPYYPINANIIYFETSNKINRYIQELLRPFELYWALKKERDKFDIILATHNSTALPVWLATKYKKNGFYYIQAYEPEFYTKKPYSFYFKLIAKTSYKLNLTRIVNSNIYLNFKEIKAKYLVEPGIDLSVFTPKKNIEKSSDIIFIGCIGRHTPWKGTKEIVQAFLLSHRQLKVNYGIEIVLNIAFEIPEDLVSNENPFIKFFQPHGDDNLSDFYKTNDIFIATGLLQDGAFHYPCMESLASGCIVISNYSPASEEDSYFLREVTTQKIHSALMTAVLDKLKNCEKKVLKGKIEKFSWKNQAKKMHDIFIENKSTPMS